MLQDQFGRIHDYLRISLTEKCNLRCFYCMPPEGVQLSPKENIMTSDEIESIAKIFVSLGVSKIRLTGGEPLVRKDFRAIVNKLSLLPIELAITSNGVLIDHYIDLFIDKKINKVNISLDTLNPAKFNELTRRNYFDRVFNNINLLLRVGISPKINVVIIKGVNDDEIIDLINLTHKIPFTIQFIEYMPFIGNKWDKTKCVSYAEILEKAKDFYGSDRVIKISDNKNDTSKKYTIKNHQGDFGVIATVSNPFCDSCNRIRLTADGKIKNCLFSSTESDLLTNLRAGNDIKDLIIQSLYYKNKERGGIKNFISMDSDALKKNRSMILIGG